MRAVLVTGATSVVAQVRAGNSKNAFAPWVAELLKRKAPKLVAVALANKMARIAWKLMVSGQAYADQTASAALASAA